MIARHWPLAFRQQYEDSWPTRYCTVDTETSGFSFDKDVILEIGHCLVEDCKVVDRLNLVLDWSNHPVVPASYVKNKIQYIRDIMAKEGREWGMSFEKMKNEGMDPFKALCFYRDLFATLAASGMPFVAHNGFFDEKMLACCFAGFGVADGFSFPDNQFFDTASLEKANQLVGDRDVMPREGESLKGYFRRIKYLKRNGVKSNLDTHCAVKYRFAEEHGLDMRQAPSASFDAFMVHLLMEEYRRQLEAESSKPVTSAKIPTLFVARPAREDSALDNHPESRPRQPGDRRRGQRNR